MPFATAPNPNRNPAMSSDEPESSQRLTPEERENLLWGITPEERENLLWLKLPVWADDVPENIVEYMLEETAIRYRLPLQPYDPNNKERGRKILLSKKRVAKKRCMACGKEDEHFTFQCPNDPERDLVEQELINSDDFVMLCVNCGKKDDHFSWKCPELGTIPFGPIIEEDMFCEVCGIEGEHSTDVCTKVWKSPEPKPGFRECLICCKYDDSEHWTEDCPVLANGDRKFCWNCESLSDHLSEDCPVIVKEDVNFCTCCALVGGHLTEDCPRETNDGRKYCAICNWMCSHSTEKCPLAELAEPAATGTGIVTWSKI